MFSAAIHAEWVRENIHVLHQTGRLRLSIHGYNTVSDVECFLTTLRSALARFRA